MMGRFPPRPATPADIAQYGHSAALIREYLERTDQSPADLNRRLGANGSAATVYHWLSAKGSPGPKARPKLAALIGCAEEELERRPLDDAAAPPWASAAAPPVSHGGTPPGGRVPPPAPPPPPPRDVLTFAVNAAGLTRIRLDVTLPHDRGMMVLRQLLDAGVAFTPPPAEEEEHNRGEVPHDADE